VFSPALPLGARASGAGVTMQPTPGDVHASVRASLLGAAEVSVTYAGGWTIVPPSMPAAVGHRSEAPRVLSERFGADGRYVVSLEGLAGRTYAFRVRTPDATVARTLRADASTGSVVVPADGGASTDRTATITFASTGANADGYVATTVSFGVPRF
jgi:hypothetical protein